jgi:predicted RecA/RadA family phage recombinase
VGGVASGDGVLINEGLFGVAATSADAGDEFEMALVGVFELPKQTSDVFAFGQSVFWDAGQEKCIASQSTDEEKWIGAAVKAAGSGDTTVVVRLDGVSFLTD